MECVNAYLAGVFEAKGSVGIRQDKGYLYPFIAIRSNNRALLEAVKLLFPKFKGPAPVGSRSFGIFLYRMSDIREFAEAIRPHCATTVKLLDSLLEFISCKQYGNQSFRELQLLEEIRNFKPEVSIWLPSMMCVSS